MSSGQERAADEAETEAKQAGWAVHWTSPYSFVKLTPEQVRVRDEWMKKCTK